MCAGWVEQALKTTLAGILIRGKTFLPIFNNLPDCFGNVAEIDGFDKKILYGERIGIHHRFFICAGGKEPYSSYKVVIINSGELFIKMTLSQALRYKIRGIALLNSINNPSGDISGEYYLSFVIEHLR